MATNNIPNLTFDVSGEEEDLDFYVGPEPTRGAYKAKVGNLSFQEKNSKGDPMLTLRAVITEGQYAGWAGWDRIVLTDAVKWKLAQLIRALGLPDKINLRKLMTEANKGRPLGILVGPDRDQQGNATVGINRLFPISKLDEDGGYSGDDDDTNVDPDEDGADDDDAGTEDSVNDDGDGDVWTREELEELSPEDLRAVADEMEDVSYNKRTKDEALIDKILEAQGGEPDADEDGDGDSDADGDDADSDGDDGSEVYTEEELKELDPSDLKEVAESLGVEKPSSKKLLLVKQILKAQEAPF